MGASTIQHNTYNACCCTFHVAATATTRASDPNNFFGWLLLLPATVAPRPPPATATNTDRSITSTSIETPRVWEAAVFRNDYFHDFDTMLIRFQEFFRGRARRMLGRRKCVQALGMLVQSHTQA